MTTERSGLELDMYSVRARVAPAVLAAAPMLALGIAVLPLLPGAQKLWSLLAIGLTTYAALTARRAGNRVQQSLWASWGGAPTTRRMRFRDNSSAAEVARRHTEVERILGGGLRLPTKAQESRDSEAADADYTAAMARIVAMVRNRPEFRLLNIENRNYGYARNLLGLKPLGLWCAAGTFVVSVVAALVVTRINDWSAATPVLFPILVSVVAPFLWLQVDADFVKPSAQAYADRVVEALGRLPTG